ncbi:MAG TPA: homocysteine S-methyltransferase family protein [Clostridia bacterium]|nr:homocysteine S-methyltransferase family protein [Clostridia bacterium]
MQFSDAFLKKHLVFDGGMGTMLQAAGLPAGASPDVWNITNPEAVRAVHAAYLAAGANVITSNTFGSTTPRLKRIPHKPAELAAAGVRIVKDAIAASGKDAFAALDIGPLGEFLEPLGDLTEEEALEYFREEIEAGAAAGADCILIETMSALDEALVCVKAAKLYGAGLPVLCTLTYSPAGRLMTGETIESVVAALEEAGVDALGCNCGVGPEQLVALLPRFTACATKPLVMQPNAGLPEYKDGQTVYLVGAETFAAEMQKLAQGGVWGLGGCCGTTPEHIARVAKVAAE